MEGSGADRIQARGATGITRNQQPMNENENENENEINTGISTLAKLPLWKHLADRMIAEGLEYGKEFPTEFFEQELRIARQNPNYKGQLGQIRRRIFNETGFCLHGYGSNGNWQRILEPAQNLHKGQLMVRTARRRLRDTVRITQTTDREKLTAEERQRMEQLEVGASRKYAAFLQTDRETRKEHLLA